MKTIHRESSKYKPPANNRKTISFLHSKSITELIKLADDWCSRYGYDYDEPIYKVVEAPNRYESKTPNVSPLNSRRNSVIRTKEKMKENFFYEVRLRKVV